MSNLSFSKNTQERVSTENSVLYVESRVRLLDLCPLRLWAQSGASMLPLPGMADLTMFVVVSGRGYFHLLSSSDF